MRYAMISLGTDTIRFIQFYDSETEEYIFQERFAGKQPIWEDNSATYEAVKYFGTGYSIRELHSFSEGKIQKINQYLGSYHGIGEDQVDPFCPRYSILMYANLPDLLTILKGWLYRPEGEYISNFYKIEFLLTEIENRENILKLLDESNILLKLMVEDKHYFEVSVYVSYLIPIIDRAVESEMLLKQEKFIYQDIILSTLGVDKGLLPWLYL